MQSKNRLCTIPETIQFEYYPQQQMHSFIQIQNLTDQIISFKIKTNTASQYLVRPMQGQIYKQQKRKIVFKRKKILLQVFEQLQKSLRPMNQKFMFNITCKSKNAIGIQKTDEQVYYMDVKFGHPKKQNTTLSPIKKARKPTKTSQPKKPQSQLANIINREKTKLNQLRQLRKDKQLQLQAFKSQMLPTNTKDTSLSPQSLTKQLSMNNIICLVIIFFLLGLWI